MTSNSPGGDCLPPQGTIGRCTAQPVTAVLLVAETSYEARNLFLDRALMVDTMEQTEASFFPA
jgi:hypothetical protein